MQQEQVMDVLTRATSNLLDAGRFENGWVFKQSQREALEAFQYTLRRNDLNAARKMRVYFDLATGLGKTGVFLGVLNEAYKIADAEGLELKSVIVEPTNKLQEQTAKAAIEKFSPGLKNRIGFYGGGEKDVSKSITIITYRSWKSLLRDGTLSSDNVDIIVKDESHRGISEEHQEEFNESFDNRTFSMAYTATSEFDEDKTVELTHPQLVHKVSIADAVRRDELAAYIHTQCYTIRVEPPDTEVAAQFKRASEKKRTAVWELKKSAWNEHMLDIYQGSVDEFSGDLLSDNKTGFFVFDTAQADELEKRLNETPSLRKKAHQMGCKAVSVAIHSRIRPPAGTSYAKEIKRRFDDFEAGKYMAIVGDESFKEGWDYEPLKTIFDYPRGSRVDEGQIIGRGTRPWNNPRKGGRSEGLTVVNSIIYMGSPDQEEDKKRRLRARTRAIIAADILGDTELESPRFKIEGTRIGKKGPQGRSKSAPVKKNVSTCTMEDMDVLVGDREKYLREREDYVPISTGMQKQLQEQEKRTGLGGHAIFNRMIDPPVGLTVSMSEQIVAGVTYSALEDHILAILYTYEEQPDTVVKPIGQENLSLIYAEVERTGLGGQAIFKRIKAPPDTLTLQDTKSIVHGNTLTAAPENIAAIIRAYSLQPDKKPAILKNPISEEDAKHLLAEKQRTQLGGEGIVKRMTNPPQGLTGQRARGIIIGKSNSAPIEWVKAIKNTYAHQKTRKLTGEKKIVSEEDIESLKLERERTGVSGAVLYKLIVEPPPELTVERSRKIVEGKMMFATDAEIEVLKQAYRKLPDSKLKPISAEDKLHVAAELKRTGLKGSAVFKRGSSLPAGLTVTICSLIINGKIDDADPEHVKAIKKTYKKIPDKKPRKPRPAVNDNASPLKLISKQDVLFFEQQAERTGLGGVALFGLIADPPAKLTRGMSAQIVAGKTKSARPEHVQALKDVFAKQVDAVIRPISEADISFLRCEAERTGLGGQRIFNLIPSPPEELTKEKIFNVLAGKTSAVSPESIVAIKAAYAEQPDKACKLKAEPISTEDRVHFRSEVERTGLKGMAALKTIDHPPAGLTFEYARDMVSGTKKKAPLEYICVLKEAYSKLPDCGVKFRLEPVSPADAAFLKSEVERTGLGGSAMFRRMSNPPASFKWTTARGLASGKVKKAVPEYVEALKQAYRDQPDKPAPSSTPEP